MTRPPTVDVEIAGEGYMFAPGERGGGVRLGFTEQEPVGQGQIGSIEIPSFHLGPGDFTDAQPGKYWQSVNVEPSVPGNLGRVGAATEILQYGDQLTPVTGTYMGGMLLVTPQDGAAADRIVTVYANAASVFDAVTGANLTQDANSETWDGEYTGSIAKHKGKVYAPIEYTETVIYPPFSGGLLAAYDPATDSFSYAGQEIGGNDQARLSRVLSSRRLFFMVRNFGLGAVPTISAHPDAPTNTPYADPPTGPYELSPGNYCTGLVRFGRWVRYAMADGNLHGVDEEGDISPLLPELLASPSSTLGSHMVAFLDKIIINAPGRIFAVDLASLQVSDITPSVLQPNSAWSTDAPTPALFSDGIELWAAVQDADDGTKIALWRLGQYPDGSVSWHRIARYQASDSQFPRALLVYDAGYGEGRFAHVLSGPDALGKMRVHVIRVPRPGQPHGIGSGYETTDAFLETSLYRTNAMVSARFLAFRGFQHETPSPATSVGYALDGAGSFTALGSISAAGPFTLPFPASPAIGRLAQLRISGDVGHLHGPFYLDYLTLPATTDDLTIEVYASDSPVKSRAGVGRRSRMTQVQALRALKGTTTSVKFLDSVDSGGLPTAWIVQVVDVVVQRARRAGSRPEESVVTLQVRRL